MERSSFFNAELVDEQYDRVYNAEDFARYFASFIGSGIFPNPTTNLQVKVDNGMQIIISTGKAWINGYFYENTSELSLQLTTSDGVLNRIDRVVLRLDLVNREIKCHIKTGTTSSNPTVQPLQRDSDIYEVALADIYIAKGTTKLSQSNIKDQRFDTDLCGVVTGVVNQIDTTNLFSQFQTAFELWFDEIKGKLSEDQAGNLQLQIREVNEALNQIKSNYQVKNDESLNTNNKGIVGAINELFSMTSQFWTNEKCEIKTGTVDTSFRFPNGLQINIMKLYGTWDITTEWGSVYSSPYIAASNYIQSFITPPQVSVTAHGAGTAIMICQAGAPTTTAPGSFYLWKPVQQTGVRDYIEIISIGRWK